MHHPDGHRTSSALRTLFLTLSQPRDISTPADGQHSIILGLRTEWACVDRPAMFNRTLAITFHVLPPTRSSPVTWNTKFLSYHQHLMRKCCLASSSKDETSNHVPCSLALCPKDLTCFSHPKFIDRRKHILFAIWRGSGVRERLREFVFLKTSSSCFMTSYKPLIYYSLILWANCSFFSDFPPLSFLGWPVETIFRTPRLSWILPNIEYSCKNIDPRK